MSRPCKIAVLGVATAASFCLAAEPADLLSKLRAAGVLRCQPSHPVFCANVHVACVGQTRTPTFPFQLRATETSGSIKSDGDTAALHGLYDSANAIWDSSTQSLILQPVGANGYVRLQSDGRYVFRYYIGAVGVMSLGRCE